MKRVLNNFKTIKVFWDQKITTSELDKYGLTRSIKAHCPPRKHCVQQASFLMVYKLGAKVVREPHPLHPPLCFSNPLPPQSSLFPSQKPASRTRWYFISVPRINFGIHHPCCRSLKWFGSSPDADGLEFPRKILGHIVATNSCRRDTNYVIFGMFPQ